MYSGFSYRMSMTPVPISIRSVRAPMAARSGNGEASWRSKWWTRTKAPSTPRSSAAWARSMVCRRASAAVRVWDPAASRQCPKDRKPIFFTSVRTKRGRDGFPGGAAPTRAD